MKLDPDCIRNILLVVEEKSGYGNSITSTDFINSNRTSKYPLLFLNYHIKQAYEANLISKVSFYYNNNFAIGDLTPEGHKFLENIRAPKNWSKTKEIAKKTGKFTLSAFESIATSVASGIIKNNLGL